MLHPLLVVSSSCLPLKREEKHGLTKPECKRDSGAEHIPVRLPRFSISTILFAILTDENFIILLTLNPAGIILTRKWRTVFWAGPHHKCKENWLTPPDPWTNSRWRQSPQCFSKWSSRNHKKHKQNRGGSISSPWRRSDHQLLNSAFLKFEHANRDLRDLRILWVEHLRKMLIWFWVWWT